MPLPPLRRPGSYWNRRISYADSEDGKTNWVKNPVPTFDPGGVSRSTLRFEPSVERGRLARGAGPGV